LKILLSRPDKIGDVVLALHGAKQIKQSLPDATVFMDVSDYTRALVENVKFVDGCVKFGENLAAYKFDVVVDLMAKFKTIRHYFTQRVPKKIGNAARWFSFLYNKRATVRRSQAKINEAEYNWMLIQLVDNRLASVPLTESLTLEDFKEITAYAHTRPYILLMPGASVSAFPLPESEWIDIAKELSQDPSHDIVFIGGPAEKEIFSRLADILSPITNIKFITPQGFSALLGVLKDARGYIGPSTGVTHLASAARLKGVALYPDVQSMHPQRWQPFQSSLVVKFLSPELRAAEVVSALRTELLKPER
jgi:ADP-heptose:LPS heptosyltransferase